MNSIVIVIHTEFRALNIEIPTVVERRTEGFSNFFEDLVDDSSSEGRDDKTKVKPDG